MKYLILETVAAKPLLETSGEIALDLIKEGHSVVFAFIGNNLPWTDWDLPVWLTRLGCSLPRRVARFEQIIADEGVQVMSSPRLTPDVLDRCQRCSESFSGTLEDLKRYRCGNAKLGMGVASSLISWSGDSIYDVAQRPEAARQLLHSAAIVYERAISMIRAHRPDTVVTFNGRFATCKPIVEAAVAELIPVLRHDRGATFDKYELYDEPIHSFEYIRRRINQAWQMADPCSRIEMGHSFFVRRRGGDGIGWFPFVDKQTQGEIPERIPGRRRVVYFSSSDDEYAAISDMVLPGLWGRQVDAIQDVAAICNTIDDVELIIRIHPNLAKKSSAERKRWSGFANSNVRVIPPESNVDSYALLDSADIVVTYGSTIGIEAAYWGKLSVLIGPTPHSGLGACVEPTTKEKFIALLAKKGHAVAEPQEKCLPFGYYYTTFGRKFKHYQPSALLRGKFLGHSLDWDTLPIRWLRRLGVGRIYNNITRTMR